MKPSRRELRWLLLSYLFWAFLASHLGGTSAAFSNFTDHWSHWGRAVLFYEHGLDVYREPTSRFCSDPSPQVREKLPPAAGCNWCAPKGAADTRPLCVNWQFTRASYPPGLFLYSLPEVLLFEATSLSYRAINLFSILKFLLAAHLLLWLFFRMVVGTPGDTRWERAQFWLRLGLLALAWVEVGKWTLGGFYDPVSVAVLFLGIWLLAQDRGLDALLALSAAVFLHYRALWYLPLFFVTAREILKNREWKAAGTVGYVKLAAAAAMLGVSAYAFALIYPALNQLPPANVARLQSLLAGGHTTWLLLALLSPVVVYLAWRRQWTLLACVGWQLAMLVRTPQVQWWHNLFLLPMFALAAPERKLETLVSVSALYLTESMVVFGNALPGQVGWQLMNLMQRWQPWW